MNDTHIMLKWTSGGSLYKVEDIHDAISPDTTGEVVRGRPHDAELTDDQLTMEQALSRSNRNGHEPKRDFADAATPRTVDGSSRSKRRRDRSLPPRPKEQGSPERRDLKARRGNLINKFKKIFTRSSSKGPNDSKSAPNSPTSSKRTFDEVETSATTVNSVDGPPPPSSASKVKRSKSRLERLIDAKREYRRQKEWHGDSQPKAAIKTFVDENDGGYTRHYSKGGKRRRSFPNTADITLSFTDNRNSRRQVRDEKRKTVSPAGSSTLESKKKYEPTDIKPEEISPENAAKRCVDHCHSKAQSDTCILWRRQDSMLERINRLETLRAQSNNVSRHGWIEKNCDGDKKEKHQSQQPEDDAALLNKLFGLSQGSGNNDTCLQKWLEKVKQIDPFILCEVKSSLKKVKGATKEGNIYTPLGESKSLVDTYRHLTRYHSRRDENFPPKPALKNSLPISPPSKIAPSDLEMVQHPCKSVTKNNNNGHKSVHARNNIDVLALESFPKSSTPTHSFIEGSSRRTSFPTSFDKSEHFPDSFHNKTFLHDSSQRSRVKTIVNTLEEKLSRSLNAPPTIVSLDSSSSKCTLESSIERPTPQRKTATPMISFSRGRSAAETVFVGQSFVPNSHATSSNRSSELSLSKDIETLEGHAVDYFLDTRQPTEWSQQTPKLTVVENDAGEDICEGKARFKEMSYPLYCQKAAEVSYNDNVSSVSLIVQKSTITTTSSASIVNGGDDDIKFLGNIGDLSEISEKSSFVQEKNLNEDDAPCSRNASDLPDEYGNENTLGETRQLTYSVRTLADDNIVGRGVSDSCIIDENMDNDDATDNNIQGTHSLSRSSSHFGSAEVPMHLRDRQGEGGCAIMDFPEDGHFTKWDNADEISYKAVLQDVDNVKYKSFSISSTEDTPDLGRELITEVNHNIEEARDVAGIQNSVETYGVVEKTNNGDSLENQVAQSAFESCYHIVLSTCTDVGTPSENSVTALEKDWNKTKSDTHSEGTADLVRSENTSQDIQSSETCNFETDSQVDTPLEIGSSIFQNLSLADEQTGRDETSGRFNEWHSCPKLKVDDSEKDTWPSEPLQKEEASDFPTVAIQANQNHVSTSLTFTKTVNIVESREPSEESFEETLTPDFRKTPVNVFKTMEASCTSLEVFLRQDDKVVDFNKSEPVNRSGNQVSEDDGQPSKRRDAEDGAIRLKKTSSCSLSEIRPRTDNITGNIENMEQAESKESLNKNHRDLSPSHVDKTEEEVPCIVKEGFCVSNEDNVDELHSRDTSNPLDDMAIRGFSFTSSESPTNREILTLGNSSSLCNTLNNSIISAFSTEAEVEVDSSHSLSKDAMDVASISSQSAVGKDENQDPLPATIMFHRHNKVPQSHDVIKTRDENLHENKIITECEKKTNSIEEEKCVNKWQAKSSGGSWKKEDVNNDSQSTERQMKSLKSPISIDQNSLWDDVTYNLSLTRGSLKTNQKEKKPVQDPCSIEEANVTHTLHDQSIDSVTSRIVDYYRQLHGDIAPKPSSDTWDDATMDSVDFSFTTTGLSDWSTDGSGDRSKSRDAREQLQDSQSRFFQALARPNTAAAIKAKEDFASESSSHFSLLAAVRKGGKLLKYKRQRQRPDVTSKRNLKRNRYVKEVVSEKAQNQKVNNVQVQRSRSGHEGGKSSFDKEYRLKVKDDGSQRRHHPPTVEVFESSISLSRNKEDEPRRTKNAHGADKSLTFEYQREKERSWSNLDFEYRPKQWLFLATMLFFQFIIHWFYAR